MDVSGVGGVGKCLKVLALEIELRLDEVLVPDVAEMLRSKLGAETRVPTPADGPGTERTEECSDGRGEWDAVQGPMCQTTSPPNCTGGSCGGRKEIDEANQPGTRFFRERPTACGRGCSYGLLRFLRGLLARAI